MLEEHILKGNSIMIHDFFNKVQSEIKYLIETDDVDITLSRINSSLNKINRKISLMMCIYYPNIDMFSLYLETVNKTRSISGKNFQDKVQKINMKLNNIYNWCLELVRIKPNPIGVYLFELYLLYINRFIQDNHEDISVKRNSANTVSAETPEEDSNTIPTHRYTKVYAHMNSVKAYQLKLYHLRKLFKHTIVSDITISELLGHIIRIYSVHSDKPSKFLMHMTHLLTVNVENQSAGCTSSIYTRLYNAASGFKDFRIIYLIIGHLITDQSIDVYDFTRVIFGNNRSEINIKPHTEEIKYKSKLYETIPEIFIETLNMNHIMRYNLLEKFVQTEYSKRTRSYTDSVKYDKYVIEYPKTFQMLTLSKDFIEEQFNRNLFNSLLLKHINFKRSLYTYGDVLKFSEFQKMFSRDYSSYIPYIINGKLFQTRGYIGIYYRRKDLTDIVRRKHHKNKFKHLNAYVGPFNNIQHMQDYTLTYKLKHKLKLCTPEIKQIRILTRDVKSMHVKKSVEVLTDARIEEWKRENVRMDSAEMSNAEMSNVEMSNAEATPSETPSSETTPAFTLEDDLIENIFNGCAESTYVHKPSSAQTYAIYTFQMNQLNLFPEALEQYLCIKLPYVEPFHIDHIQSFTDDVFKLFMKELLLKRILFDKPLVLFKDRSSEILVEFSNNKPVNIISLNDIIYTTSLSAYNLEAIPDTLDLEVDENKHPNNTITTLTNVSGKVLSHLNNHSNTISLTEHTTTNISDTITASVHASLQVLSLLLFPEITSQSILKLFLQNIIRFRKSYLQFLSTLTKLLNKSSAETSIIITLLSRVNRLIKLLSQIK